MGGTNGRNEGGQVEQLALRRLYPDTVNYIIMKF